MAGCIIFKLVNCIISPDLGFKSSEQVSWDHINIYIDLLIKYASVLNGSTFSHRTLCSDRVQIFQASTPTPLYTSPSYNTCNKKCPSFGFLVGFSSLTDLTKSWPFISASFGMGEAREITNYMYQIVHIVPVILEKNHGASRWLQHRNSYRSIQQWCLHSRLLSVSSRRLQWMRKLRSLLLKHMINMNIIHMQYNRASRNNMDDKDDKHNKYVMIIKIHVTTLINLNSILAPFLVSGACNIHGIAK